MKMENRRKSVTSVLLCNRLYLETILHEENSSSEDEAFQQLVLIKLRSKINPRKRKLPRCQRYVEEVIPRYLPGEFQAQFRLSPTAFEALCEQLIPILKGTYTTGRPLDKPEKKVLSVIWLLATPDSYRSVGAQFDMGKSSLSDAFIMVIKALQELAPRVIRWPHPERRERIIQSFRSFAGIDNVVGAIDGTYVPIKAPISNPEVYTTRKCYYAVTLQAIAEPSLQFLDCFAGYPGSVGDARIFRNSYIYRQIQRSPENFFENTFIIGDKAYPLHHWCIPPYIERQRLSPVQRFFNSAHAKTRQVVERSFALLFGRFRRLHYLNMNRIDLIPATIIACCTLHNICLNYEDLMIENYIQEGLPFVQEHNYNNHFVCNEEQGPRNVRDNIAQQLFERRRRRNRID